MEEVTGSQSNSESLKEPDQRAAHDNTIKKPADLSITTLNTNDTNTKEMNTVEMNTDEMDEEEEHIIRSCTEPKVDTQSKADQRKTPSRLLAEMLKSWENGNWPQSAISKNHLMDSLSITQTHSQTNREKHPHSPN